MTLGLDGKPRTKARPRLASGGGVPGGKAPNGGAPDPPPAPQRREWPLALAVLAAVLLAVLLTWLGMYTQIRANLTGSQLPGA